MKYCVRYRDLSLTFPQPTHLAHMGGDAPKIHEDINTAHYYRQLQANQWIGGVYEFWVEEYQEAEQIPLDFSSLEKLRGMTEAVAFVDVKCDGKEWYVEQARQQIMNQEDTTMFKALDQAVDGWKKDNEGPALALRRQILENISGRKATDVK